MLIHEYTYTYIYNIQNSKYINATIINLLTTKINNPLTLIQTPWIDKTIILIKNPIDIKILSKWNRIID
jgi:hypothetical protein